ncbi:MAG: hypothetical protein B7C54_03830 [Acidimicrobiales bacterium mtb01]|nr:nucleotide sugar dehydrogenase [Actinomycetota bacterium]TEX47417.1 MAG: hypothetical protein B7C54_03830 [Acidimicrobiales bacterium mtb01]
MSSRLAVIGTGYVGLTTGVCLAHLGHRVVCADIDASKIARLVAGELPIVEDGLAHLLAEGLESGRLSFVVGGAAAVADCDIAFLCVPTPQGDDGSADLSYIETAAREIASALPAGAIVVNKSTVPVGSTKVVERALGRPDVRVVSNPEFLREGSAVRDFLHPDRVVVGADDLDAAQLVADLYSSLDTFTLVTDPPSAETIKYAANAFLATKLSFVNAIAAVCEGVGANIDDVVTGIGSDKRIGAAFLQPGPGWGGSCFDGRETVLVKEHHQVRLMRFDELFASSTDTTRDVLSWDGYGPRPIFKPLQAVTSRPYEGDMIAIKTKMGRRLRVTADHPFVAMQPDGSIGVVDAAELTTSHWLPLTVGQPSEFDRHGSSEAVLIDTSDDRTDCSRTHVRLGTRGAARLARHIPGIMQSRLHEVRRSNTANPTEVVIGGLLTEDASLSTVRNGTFVPIAIDLGPDFWQVVGLYLAEGHSTQDGRRRRLQWSFHPHHEEHFVDLVSDFWTKLGVKVTRTRRETTSCVTISSRLFAAWFVDELGLGTSAYDHRIPDAIWNLDDECQRMLLRGLWLGDGSWSYVNGGPSVVLEYGTVSRSLADGMVRLLAQQGIVARLKVGRTAKATADTYWLTISGADQIRRCVWLLEDDEREIVLASIDRQAREIRPTGYRVDAEGRTWVRVVEATREHASQFVYSVEVADTHTVVTSFGLVAHNCFPKDSRAMVKIANDAGYRFDLLSGVITVNEQQYDRAAQKVIDACGGSVFGKIVAVWGLTFKAGTDDLRESPSLHVVERLVAAGARIVAHDPTVTQHRIGLPTSIEIAASPTEACRDATALCVLTEWPEYASVTASSIASVMSARTVVDARNILDREAWKSAGFTYQGIGR